jgi:hypothetical protein
MSKCGKMTEDEILKAMTDFPIPDSLTKMEEDLEVLFMDEWGEAWFKKEMKTAIQVLTPGNRKTVTMLKQIMKEDLPKMTFDEYWIGSKAVGKEDFRVYARTVYFLAAMKILKGEGHKFSK